MSGRSQCVYIDGALSSLLDVQVGVPQGSILGPLFYVCFTNDAPETVHEHGADIDVGMSSTHNVQNAVVSAAMLMIVHTVLLTKTLSGSLLSSQTNTL